MGQFPPQQGETAAQPQSRVCHMPRTQAVDCPGVLAEALRIPQVAERRIPPEAVDGLRVAVRLTLPEEGVAAQRVRRAAREPAATTNVDCRKCRAKEYKDKVRLNSRSGIVAAERTTELHRAEAELITKLVGGLSELLELLAPVGFEQVQLLRTV
jgi:hypothetical protein